MKKLLSILAITTTMTSFSTTTISCNSDSSSSSTKSESLILDIENKIENGNNSIIRGDNLSTDASDNLTQTTILNTIGLTNEEKTYVTTSGTLNDNENSEITYNIYDLNNFNLPSKTITNNIKLQKLNYDLKSSEWYDNFSEAHNLTLYNQKQLVISNVYADSPISDVNLDYESDYTLPDGGGGSMYVYDYEFNHAIYGIYTISDKKSRVIYMTPNSDNPDEYGNYIHFGNSSSNNNYRYLSYASSNNNLYTMAIENNSYAPVIFDITNEVSSFDNNIVAQLSSGFESDVTSLNTIWNLDGTLYVGTNAGLYKSTDNGKSYSLISDTKTLNINSIISNVTGNKIFFGSDTGLYESIDKGKNFQIVYGTDGHKINEYSLFIDNNDNLFYDVENGGLWSIDLSQENLIPSQIITDNISSIENIKSIVQYYDNTLILLTDKDLVYLTD